MHATVQLTVGILAAVLATRADAQSMPARDHIAYVADAFDDTPGLQGLLPTAVAEAVIVAEHVELANSEGLGLADVQLHMLHVLHALDPSVMLGEPGLLETGPGLGYGVRHAASAAAAHLAAAVQDSTASENLRFHAERIGTVLVNVALQIDQIAALAERIRATSSATTAASLLANLTLHAETLTMGRDFDRDGLVGWAGAEGGLRQASQHMTLLKRGEGMTP